MVCKPQSRTIKRGKPWWSRGPMGQIDNPVRRWLGSRLRENDIRVHHPRRSPGRLVARPV